MFNFVKISQELSISNWEYFIGAYNKLKSIDLSKYSFNENFYNDIVKSKIDISYYDFIYISCFTDLDFKESINKQISSGHLTQDYVNNTKPNILIINVFNKLRNTISSNDTSFINSNINQLSFIYNQLNLGKNKLKLISNKLSADDIDNLDNDSLIKLFVYYIFKNDNAIYTKIDKAIKSTYSLIDEIKELSNDLKSRNYQTNDQMEAAALNNLYSFSINPNNPVKLIASFFILSKSKILDQVHLDKVKEIKNKERTLSAVQRLLYDGGFYGLLYSYDFYFSDLLPTYIETIFGELEYDKQIDQLIKSNKKANLKDFLYAANQNSGYIEQIKYFLKNK